MMKRFYVLFATLLALNICIPPVTHAQDGDVVPVDADQVPDDAEAADAVVIIDIHLASAIRSTLGLAEDATLTATDMLNLRSLEAKEAGITDLRGLEHATNLTTLNLYPNQLTDLRPLSGLERLISLDLGKNTITDIEALSGLTALTTLHLDGNQLTDFRPLSSLTDLSVLHLSRTGISDLSVLGNLTTLTQLYLTGNAISDISVLSGLTEMGWLFLAQNQISDVSPLMGIEALISLRLLGNPVSNASVLYGLTQGSLIDVDIEILPPADTDPPSVTIAIPSDPQQGAFDVTITFSETASSFDQADLSISGTASASITAWNTTNNTVFTATITPTTSGNVILNISADVATDAAGNKNTAATEQKVVVEFKDETKPVVSISVPSGTQSNAFEVTITFTEAVSGFVQADLSVSGTASASITVWNTTDNTVYTATVTPTTSGTVILDVAADVATDAAGNQNTAATQQSVEVDIAAPVSIPNAALANLVRTALGLAADATITTADMQRLTSLGGSAARRLRINDLTGLEHATNLTSLTLSRNNISDLLPLSNLMNLTTLALSRNSISNLSPLSGLTGLTTLNLKQNSISNLSPLSNLMSLTTLGLKNNNITDISPLASLVSGGGTTSLVTLELQHNDIPSTEVNSDALRTLKNAGVNVDITLPAAGNAPSNIETGALPPQTQLLANYPNPFNPETWIPYHLLNPSDVQITIYDTRGTVVRQLELGHQREGYYTRRSRAAYWDGRNDFGECVASGVYFYQLRANEVSPLRKMVILK